MRELIFCLNLKFKIYFYQYKIVEINFNIKAQTISACSRVVRN